MARPRKISDEQILDAAKDVFLEQGASGTTAEIARRAGVSEGTIFKRFSTKNELFQCALGLPSEPPFLPMIRERVGRGVLEQNLHDILNEMLDFFERIMPKILMLLASRISPEAVFALSDEPPPVKVIKTLRALFEHEAKLGRIREGNCELIAMSFVSSAHFFVFGRVSGLDHHIPMRREHFVEDTVDQLLRGVGGPNVDRKLEPIPGCESAE